jgi:membrane associated rhomboid family serine protease
VGIYDREYYRQDRRPAWLAMPQSVIGAIVLANVVLFLANGLFTPDRNLISDALTLRASDLDQPLHWWRVLSYGFVHGGIAHILFNMLGLWFLGREVEGLYGRGEFLRVYLAMIVAGGLVWAVTTRLRGIDGGLVGASGAVTGVVLLFALNFPRRTVVLFPIPIPMPAWVLGLLVVLSDLAGSFGTGPQSRGPVAYVVHLTGAAFAGLYFYLHWDFGKLARFFSFGWLRSKPSLRLHRPEEQPADLNEEVDRILEKISREGETSLTRKERRTLENASRQYQRRRREES